MVASDEKSEVSAEESIGKASEEEEVMEEDRSAEILCLNPAKLMMIEIEVGGNKCRALLDSGASRTLIKERVWVQRGGEINVSDQCVIGLGDGRSTSVSRM